MNATLIFTAAKPFEMSTAAGYITGAIIALFILAYLVYSLIKPEKF